MNKRLEYIKSLINVYTNYLPGAKEFIVQARPHGNGGIIPERVLNLFSASLDPDG